MTQPNKIQRINSKIIYLPEVSSSNGTGVRFLNNKFDNILKNYGYSLEDNDFNRMKALNKALKFNSKNKILKYINTYKKKLKTNNNISHKNKDKLNNDYKWIQKNK
uniref:Uncharacterized protein n=1 Tax=viral metagenome TaxID=1070528 RepID=A0A6C0H785_9ZZZZ